MPSTTRTASERLMRLVSTQRLGGNKALIATAVAGLIAYRAHKVMKKRPQDGEGAKHDRIIVADSFVDKIKIVALIRYIYNLVRDLADPTRLGKDKKDYVKRLLSIVWPRFTGPSSPETAGRELIGLLLGVSIAKTWLMDHTTSLTRRLSKSVFSKGHPGLSGLFMEAGGMIFVGSLVMSLRAYAESSLQMTFRKKLVERVQESYFKSMSYYHISNLPGRSAIADADERVTQEIISVTARLTTVVTLLFKALPPVFWFTYKLWRSNGFVVAFVPHMYLLCAYEVAQRVIPKDIGDYWRKKAVKEGVFNKGVSRTINHSEAIVALDGGNREKVILNNLFNGVHEAGNNLSWILSKRGLIFKLAYTYGCRTWIQSFVMLPLLWSAQAGGSEQFSSKYGNMRYSWQMMIEMLVANGNMLTLHATALHMASTSKRICTLMDTLDQLNEDQAKQLDLHMKDGDFIGFDNVEIQTPTSHVLVKNLSFKLKENQSLLLTGHNGAGKSSIFRVLGGLWKTPSGSITKPGAGIQGLNQAIFYLPQKPYNVLGTLKANIVYPSTNVDVLDDERLKELLLLVELSHLLIMTEDSEDDGLINWENKLSLGEQQRLAMARLFYHVPKFAILDECTSAVSMEMESLLYSECIRLGITYITICHRPQLRVWHDINLNLLGDGNGGFELKDINVDPKERKKLIQECDSIRKAKLTGNYDTSKGFSDHLESRSLAYKAWNKSEAVKKRRGMVSQMTMLMKLMVPGSRKQLFALLLAILSRTAVHELYSFTVGQLFGATMTGNAKRFIIFCAANMGVDILTSCIDEGNIYLQQLVAGSWYQNLTTFALKKIMENNNFYTIRNLDGSIKDPDQRITQEIRIAAENFAEIWGKAVTPIIDITWFSVRLYSLIGLKGIQYIGAYFLFSAMTVKLLIPDHEKLDRKEKQFESTFKFVHNRLRNHAESIAFFGGDDTEHVIADQQFNLLCKQFSTNRIEDAKFGVIDRIVNKDGGDYGQMMSSQDLVTYSLQTGYVDGIGFDIDESLLASKGFYVQSATSRALDAFGKLTNIYTHVSKLLGSTSRVCEMLDLMDEMNTGAKYSMDGTSSQIVGDRIRFEDVDIVTPTGICLASKVNLEVTPLNSVMVTGPNSTGKTSLFRVLSGLWRPGAGTIMTPEGGMQLVPQKVYSVTGSLADQVTYPKYISSSERTQDDEVKIRSALDQVGVAYLIDRHGWDKIRPWEDTLSLGEQQRIGLARLLYHKPAFAVLDECTDAVSADAEKKLFESLYDSKITCITISKRLALEDFHSKNLALGVVSQTGWTEESLSTSVGDLAN